MAPESSTDWLIYGVSVAGLWFLVFVYWHQWRRQRREQRAARRAGRGRHVAPLRRLMRYSLNLLVLITGVVLVGLFAR